MYLNVCTVCMLALVSSAMFILRLGDFSNRFDPAEINGTSFFTGSLIVVYCMSMYVCVYMCANYFQVYVFM